MNEKQPTIFERVAALEAWIKPQRIAVLDVPKRDLNSGFHHACFLFYTLKNAAEGLEEVAEKFPTNPLRAINDSDLIRWTIEVDFLLPRFEQWMQDGTGGQALVENTFEFCKRRVLDGGLVRMNAHDPIQNAIHITTNSVYCEVMKTINRAVLSLQEDIDKEAAALTKKKAKAKA